MTSIIVNTNNEIMRARTTHLMTSWWVVGLWTTLGIVTGIISIATVLQPTWYVRYTLIHAQPFQDQNIISFQVVVSSVGPLGFCRLTGVEKHQVIDDAIVRSIFEKDFPTRPKESNDPTPLTEHPEVTMTTESPPWILQGEKNQETEIGHNTAVPLEYLYPSKSPKESQQEWLPSPGVHYANISSGIFLVSPSIPPSNPVRKDTEKKSGTDGELSEGFQISESIAVEKSDDIANIIFRVTEKYLNIVYENQEETTVSSEVDRQNHSLSGDERSNHETSQFENSLNEIKYNTHVDQNIDNDELKFIRLNATPIKEFPVLEHDGDTNYPVSKRKKRKRKKGRGNKNKRKHKQHIKKPGNDQRQIYDETSSKMNEVIVIPLTEARNNSIIFNKDKSFKSNMSFEGDFVAEFLIRQERSRAFESNSIAIGYYHPRTPIMECSGINPGIDSGSSSVWVLVGVVYGVAGVVQVLAGVASIVTQAVHSPANRYANAIWVGNVQVAVVMCQGVTLVLFPLGLGSSLARVECGGSSSVYWPGDCIFGWSYMLAIVATTLTAFCPCLARLTIYKRYALREWESLNFF